MTEIRFYHLTTRSLESALPEILQKALSGRHRIVVQTASEAEAERLNLHLWSHHSDSFIPHGSKKDGRADQQPIWLSAENKNPNGANVLVVTSGAFQESPNDFTLICDLFDGRDETAVTAARARWKQYKDQSDYTLTYWQQTEKGWEQKA